MFWFSYFVCSKRLSAGKGNAPNSNSGVDNMSEDKTNIFKTDKTKEWVSAYTSKVCFQYKD